MIRGFKIFTVCMLSLVSWRLEASPDHCSQILKTVQNLKEIPSRVLPEDGLSRVPSDLIAFHGTASDRFLSIQNMRSGHYEVLFEDGLSVWSLHPEVLRSRGRISHFELVNDDTPEWRNFDYENILANPRGWPIQRDLSSFALNYALGSMNGDIPLVLGFRPELYQDLRFRLSRGDSNDSSNRSIFSYAIFVPRSGAGIPFRYVHSLWFGNDSDRQAFQQELNDLEIAAQQDSQKKEESAEVSFTSIENSFEIFKNRPGFFMEQMKEASNRATLKNLKPEWQRQFREIHPETWEHFVKRYGKSLGISNQ